MGIFDFLFGKKKEEEPKTPAAAAPTTPITTFKLNTPQPETVEQKIAKQYLAANPTPKYKSDVIRAPTPAEIAAAPKLTPMQEALKKSQLDINPLVEQHYMTKNFEAKRIEKFVDPKVYATGDKQQIVEDAVNKLITATFQASEGRGALHQGVRQFGAEALNTADFLTSLVTQHRGNINLAPENAIDNLTKYLEENAPERLEQVKMATAGANTNALARGIGGAAEGITEVLLPASLAVKAVRAVPMIARMREASTVGVYAANILENVAAQLAATSQMALTKEQGQDKFMQNLAASPSVLLPFGSKLELAIAPVADYLAGRAVGMSEQDALMNAAMGFAGGVAQRSGVKGEIAGFKDARALAQEQAERIVTQAQHMRDDPFPLQKMYDKAIKDMQKSMTGENRLLGLKPDSAKMSMGESRPARLTGPEPRPEEQLPTGANKTPSEPGAPDAARQELPIKQEPEKPARTPLEGLQESASKSAEVDPFERIIKDSNTPVKERVGIFDYLRTPSKVLEKMGLKKEADLLRTQYDAYQKQLPVEIQRVTDWSKRVTAPDGNERIFQWLDGDRDVQLSSEEYAVASEVKQYLSDWADKLGLPADRRVSDYITHIFDKDISPEVNALKKMIKETKDPEQLQRFQERLTALESSREFPEDLAKLLNEDVAGSVYNPFLQQRKGAVNYKQDTWAALDAYAKRATRKYNMDPALAEVQRAAQGLEQSQYDYVKNYIDRVNMRPTKLDNLLDNTIKQIVGYKFGDRPTAAISRTVRRWIYRGTLGGNISSALKNLTQGVNTYSQLGERFTLEGYAQLAKHRLGGMESTGMKELIDQGILRDSFIQDRTLNATKKFWEKTDAGLFKIFQEAELVNRGAAYFGAKAKAIKKLGMGEEEAAAYARELVRKTQFTFDAIDTPVALGSDVAKTLGQFQSYTTKQSEFLIDMLKSRDFGALSRYAGGSLLMYYLVGQSLGLKPEDMLFPPKRLLEKQFVPPAAQVPLALAKTAMGTRDEYGRLAGPRELAGAITALIPGGVQAKKTFQGLQAIIDGGVKSSTGKSTLFETDSNPRAILQNLIFGKYSTKQANEYFKSKEGKTALDYMEDLLSSIASGSSDNSASDDLPPLPSLPSLPELPPLPPLK